MTNAICMSMKEVGDQMSEEMKKNEDNLTQMEK